MAKSFEYINTSTPVDMAYTAIMNISSVLHDMTTFGAIESSSDEDRLLTDTVHQSTMSSSFLNTSDITGSMDPMCGLNKMECPTNICYKMNDVYNGICCQFVRMPEVQFCMCKAGFTGDYCQEYNGHADVLGLFEAFAVMQKNTTNNVILLGVLLFLMAVSLAAVVIFVVIRMTRQKKVIIVEEGDETGSTSKQNLNNDMIDNVILVRSRASIMRYNSNQASYCGSCRQASQSSNIPMPLSPPGSSRTEQFSPTHAPVLSPHLEEDESEGGVSQEPVPPSSSS